MTEVRGEFTEQKIGTWLRIGKSGKKGTYERIAGAAIIIFFLLTDNNYCYYYHTLNKTINCIWHIFKVMSLKL